MPKSRDSSVQSFPLTCAQAIYHSELQADPGWRSPFFLSYRIDGPLNVEALIRALGELVDRHDALRVSLLHTSGRYPRQRTRPAPGQARLITCKRLTNATEDQFEKFARAALLGDIMETFDPYADYPFRFKLLQFNDSLHALTCTISRMVIDGSGRSILMRELWSRYDRYSRSAPSRWDEVTEDALGAAAMTFSEACSRRAGFISASFNSAPFTTDRLSRAEHFWARQAARLPAPCRFDQALRPAGEIHPGQPESCSFDITSAERLQILDRESGFSAFYWAVAAVSAVVFQISAADDIAIRVTVDTRTGPERGTVGAFTIGLPVVISRAGAAITLLRQARAAILGAVAHRNMPPDSLAAMYEEAASRYGTRSDDLIRVTEQRMPDQRVLETGNIRVYQGVYSPALNFSTSGITMHVIHRGNRLELRLSLNGKLFSTAAMREIAARLEAFLQAAERQAYDAALAAT